MFGVGAKSMSQFSSRTSTHGSTIAIAKGLDRDRAVDGTGNQIAIFGRIGGRPFTLEEMRQLMLVKDGAVRTVSDTVPDGWVPPDPDAVGAGAGGGR